LRPVIKEKGGLTGRGEFDVWNGGHLPTGDDRERRVARARRKDGCNGAFMDGHSDWGQTERMTKEFWQPPVGGRVAQSSPLHTVAKRAARHREKNLLPHFKTICNKKASRLVLTFIDRTTDVLRLRGL